MPIQDIIDNDRGVNLEYHLLTAREWRQYGEPDNDLGFNKKLECLEATGMFQSKSLQLLNNVRNKVEHEYAIPKISDLQVYYELCHAVILVIESFLNITLSKNGSFEWLEERMEKTDDLPRLVSTGRGLIIKFKNEIPALQFEISRLNQSDKTINFKPTGKQSLENYLKGFKIFFILNRNITSLSDKQALKLLRGMENA